MKLPTVTPFEALKLLRASAPKYEFSKDGFVYTLDGVQMAPSETFFPVAINEDGQPFFPAGEIDTPVIESTEWVF